MSTPSKSESWIDIEIEGSELSTKPESSLDLEVGDKAPHADAESPKSCVCVIIWSFVILCLFLFMVWSFDSIQLQVLCILNACLPAIFLVHYTRSCCFQSAGSRLAGKAVVYFLAWSNFITSIVYVVLVAKGGLFYNPELEARISVPSVFGLYSSLWHIWLTARPNSKIQNVIMALSFFAILVFIFYT